MFCQYLSQFSWHGEVELRMGMKLRSLLVAGGVPSRPGVYLIHGRGSWGDQLLYIGKAGTLKTDGTWRSQGLRERLCAKQGGLTRQRFFEKRMAEGRWDSLRIDWFVTVCDGVDILPAKAEADLLQIHYQQTRALPLWNEGI